VFSIFLGVADQSSRTTLPILNSLSCTPRGTAKTRTIFRSGVLRLIDGMPGAPRPLSGSPLVNRIQLIALSRYTNPTAG
jgi:hypothetical protein